MGLTIVFILLGLVVGGMIVVGVIAFLPSKTLGDLEKKIKSKTE